MNIHNKMLERNLSANNISQANYIILIIVIFEVLAFGGCVSTAQLCYEQGIAYSNSGQNEMAIAKFSKAIECNPNLSAAYFRRSISYSKIGQYSLAMADEDKTIQLDPEHAIAYCNRGVSHMLNKNYDAAITDFTRSIELNADLDVAYYERGWARYLKAKYDTGFQYEGSQNETTDELGKPTFDPDKHSLAWQDYYGPMYKAARADFQMVVKLSKDLELVTLSKCMLEKQF